MKGKNEIQEKAGIMTQFTDLLSQVLLGGRVLKPSDSSSIIREIKALKSAVVWLQVWVTVLLAGALTMALFLFESSSS